MTAAAVSAKFTIMNVVGAMAATATAVDGEHFVQWHSMTVIATDICMGTTQRKIGLHIVVE
jgi:hypothetical protein